MRPTLLPLVLLLACKGGDDAPDQDVTAEQTGGELADRVTADLGFDPREVPDPTFDAALLDDADVGPYFQGVLDMQTAWRDAWSLELTTPSSVARAWETCSGWTLDDETVAAGVTFRVYVTRCGDLTFTHTTTASTLTTATDLRIDGVDADGLVYDDYLMVSTVVAFGDDETGVSSMGEQNPPDPGPSWQSTLALELLPMGVTLGTSSFTGYVDDPMYGDYRPWTNVVISPEIAGEQTISVARWSLVKQEIVPWITYQHHDGECDKVVFDDDGNVVEQSAC